MSKKDWIMLTIIVIVVFTVGYVIGHRCCEMKSEGVSVTTYAPDSINL